MEKPGPDPHIDPLLVTRRKNREHGRIFGEDEKEMHHEIIRTGDNRSLQSKEALALSYLKLVYQNAHQATNQDADTEDLFQDYMFRILNRQEDFDPDRSDFGNFVIMQMRNVDSAKKVKNERRSKIFRVLSLEDIAKPPVDEPEEMVEELILLEDIQELRQAMIQLKRENRDWHSVLVRYLGLGDDDPMSLPEIGKQDGTSRSAASRKYREGVKYLKWVMNSEVEE